MDKELKQEWLVALRSGAYPQTRQDLQNDRGFCCLGVLCDISGRGKWEIDEYNMQIRYVWKRGNKSLCTIPIKELNVMGLSDDDANKLMSMNDRGQLFSTIADYIEEHV